MAQNPERPMKANTAKYDDAVSSEASDTDQHNPSADDSTSDSKTAPGHRTKSSWRWLSGIFKVKGTEVDAAAASPTGSSHVGVQGKDPSVVTSHSAGSIRSSDVPSNIATAGGQSLTVILSRLAAHREKQAIPPTELLAELVREGARIVSPLNPSTAAAMSSRQLKEWESERMSNVLDLCECVRAYQLPDISPIWNAVVDLVQPQRPPSIQRVGLEMMCACIEGQLGGLNIRRFEFFSHIRARPSGASASSTSQQGQPAAADPTWGVRLRALSLLTSEGRKLFPFANEVAELLVEWMDQVVLCTRELASLSASTERKGGGGGMSSPSTMSPPAVKQSYSAGSGRPFEADTPAQWPVIAGSGAGSGQASLTTFDSEHVRELNRDRMRVLKEHHRRFVLFVHHLFKFNFSTVDSSVMEQLINRVCECCEEPDDVSPTVAGVKGILSQSFSAAAVKRDSPLHFLGYVGIPFFDSLVRHGTLPTRCMDSVISSLCQGVNSYNKESWNVIRYMLHQRYGHSVMKTLLGFLGASFILQQMPSSATAVSSAVASELYDQVDGAVSQRLVRILRGAIFFVAMSTWGSQRVVSLPYTFEDVLSHLLQVLVCKAKVVVYEVMLSLRRLVRKYGTDLDLEWDVLCFILEQCHGLVQANRDSNLLFVARETLIMMHQLATSGRGQGLIAAPVMHLDSGLVRLFRLYRGCLTGPPVSVAAEEACSALYHMVEDFVHPSVDQWTSQLREFLRLFVVSEENGTRFNASIATVRQMFDTYQALYAEELFTLVVIPLGLLMVPAEVVLRFGHQIALSRDAPDVLRESVNEAMEYIRRSLPLSRHCELPGDSASQSAFEWNVDAVSDVAIAKLQPLSPSHFDALVEIPLSLQRRQVILDLLCWVTARVSGSMFSAMILMIRATLYWDGKAADSDDKHVVMTVTDAASLRRMAATQLVKLFEETLRQSAHDRSLMAYRLLVEMLKHADAWIRFTALQCLWRLRSNRAGRLVLLPADSDDTAAIVGPSTVTRGETASSKELNTAQRTGTASSNSPPMHAAAAYPEEKDEETSNAQETRASAVQEIIVCPFLKCFEGDEPGDNISGLVGLLDVRLLFDALMQRTTAEPQSCVLTGILHAWTVLLDSGSLFRGVEVGRLNSWLCWGLKRGRMAATVTEEDKSTHSTAAVPIQTESSLPILPPSARKLCDSLYALGGAKKSRKNVAFVDETADASAADDDSGTTAADAANVLLAYHILRMLVGYSHALNPWQKKESVQCFTIGISVDLRILGSSENVTAAEQLRAEQERRRFHACMLGLNVCMLELPQEASSFLDRIFGLLVQICEVARAREEWDYVLSTLEFLHNLGTLFSRASDDQPGTSEPLQSTQESTVEKKDSGQLTQAQPGASAGASAGAGGYPGSHSAPYGGSNHGRPASIVISGQHVAKVFALLLPLSDSSNAKMPHHLLLLVYRCLGVWFFRVTQEERIHHVASLANTMQNHMRAHGCMFAECMLDIITRFTHTDFNRRIASHTHWQPMPSHLFGERSERRTWAHGASTLVTIRTGSMGYAEVVIRRATGIIGWLLKLQNRLVHPEAHAALQMPLSTMSLQQTHLALLRKQAGQAVQLPPGLASPLLSPTHSRSATSTRVSFNAARRSSQPIPIGQGQGRPDQQLGVPSSLDSLSHSVSPAVEPGSPPPPTYGGVTVYGHLSDGQAANAQAALHESRSSRRTSMSVALPTASKPEQIGFSPSFGGVDYGSSPPQGSVVFDINTFLKQGHLARRAVYQQYQQSMAARKQSDGIDGSDGHHHNSHRLLQPGRSVSDATTLPEVDEHEEDRAFDSDGSNVSSREPSRKGTNTRLRLAASSRDGSPDSVQNTPSAMRSLIARSSAGGDVGVFRLSPLVSDSSSMRRVSSETDMASAVRLHRRETDEVSDHSDTTRRAAVSIGRSTSLSSDVVDQMSRVAVGALADLTSLQHGGVGVDLDFQPLLADADHEQRVSRRDNPYLLPAFDANSAESSNSPLVHPRGTRTQLRLTELSPLMLGAQAPLISTTDLANLPSIRAGARSFEDGDRDSQAVSEMDVGKDEADIDVKSDDDSASAATQLDSASSEATDAPDRPQKREHRKQIAADDTFAQTRREKGSVRQLSKGPSSSAGRAQVRAAKAIIQPSPAMSSTSLASSGASPLWGGAGSGELTHTLQHTQQSRSGTLSAASPAVVPASSSTSGTMLELPVEDLTPSQRANAAPLVDPTFILMQMYDVTALGLHNPLKSLTCDERLDRTLELLDRTPAKETFRVGVLYVGPGQEQEAAILNNSAGSVAYETMLRRLGQFVPLKNSPVYTGGLDRKDDTDGAFGLVWTNEFTEVCFHVATIMPTLAQYPKGENKKQHVGNDLVHVVFNDSDREYKHGTVSGVNMVSIVVSPLRRSSSSVGGRQFRINVVCKPNINLPGCGPIAAQTSQILSESSVAWCVLQTAIHATLACRFVNEPLVKPPPSSPTASSGALSRTAASPLHVSNWHYRLHQIHRLVQSQSQSMDLSSFLSQI